MIKSFNLNTIICAANIFSFSFKSGYFGSKILTCAVTLINSHHGSVLNCLPKDRETIDKIILCNLKT